MRIKFLGTGGFINRGIPYNSFLIDNVHLIEAPPDLMISLYNNGIHYHQFNNIFISHFHGDHYFGMPFFILNLFNYYLEYDKPIKRINLIGPKGIRDNIIELQKVAVAPDNPSVSWIDDVFDFVEIDQFFKVHFNDSSEMIFHRMNHAKETYGFSIIDQGKYKLTYLADTKWDDSFSQILLKKPQVVICDLNSSTSDRIKAHMSESDIIEKAMRLTGKDTQYIGTHLRDDQSSDRENLQYAQPGREYKI